MPENTFGRIREFLGTAVGRLVVASLVLIALLVMIVIVIGQTSPPKEKVIQETPTPRITRKTVPPEASGQKKEDGVETYEIYRSKDPFEPLISAQPAGGEVVPGTPTETPSITAPSKTRISLMDIFTEDGVKYASIEVGSTAYKVKEGDTFATNYKVLSIDADSVTLLYGDDRITLKLGEAVYK